MLSTIIVGVDGSERDADAVALGTLLAQAASAPLLVVSICMYPALSEPEDALARLLLEDAEKVAARAVHGVRDVSVHARALASHSPAHGLARLAEQERAALIVVGSSRRGAIGRVVAGSTPERLLHEAPCPLAIAPLGYADAAVERLTTIGVGFDAGAESHAALDAAADLARSADATLNVIGVVGTLIGPLVQTPASALATAADLDALRAREQRIVEEAIARIADLDVTVETPAGDAAATLAELSATLDLLVVGSHAYGLLRRVLRGSVSTRLARSTACPLLIVPSGVPTVTGEGASTATA